ncbi:MAG: PQQ-dependent sugar dehydrogenase, partial [Planctomycetota bacterium]
LIAVVLTTFLVPISSAKGVSPSVPKQRPAWTSSRFVGTPEPPLPLQALRWGSVQFNQPVAIDYAFSSNRFTKANHLLVLERRGGVHVVDVEFPDVSQQVLDLAQIALEAGEKLAACRDLTIDPDFEHNGHVYIFWAIQPHLTESGSRVSRFTCDVADDDEVVSIDPSSRLDIITYPSGDHVGASLNFGPDGYLWVTTGDGSRPFPPDQYRKAQDPKDFRGKVLRVDVSHATVDAPYAIPVDNPFTENQGFAPEIYAAGLRNGFRATFSPYDQSFWVGDVGWEKCEMIHKIQPGGNCGWSLYEGPHPIAPDQPTTFGEIISPAITMDRTQAQSITGGLFPSGSWRVHPSGFDVDQCYLFGCYMNGMIWAADTACDPVDLRPVASTGLKLLDFLELDLTPEDGDQTTDLLVVDIASGGLHRLVSNSSDNQQTFPRLLSQTGLFDETPQMIPAAGVLEYQPNVEMNRGGASTRRWIAAPGTDPLPVQPPGDHHPYVDGTVVAVTIFRDIVGSDSPQPIETQVLVADEIRWTPYTYRWRDDGSDADLVSAEGDRREIVVDDPRFGEVQYEHVFASRTQCLACHHVANRGPMTFRPDQLTRPELTKSPIDSPANGSMTWAEMVAIGWADPAKKLTRNLHPMRRCDDEQASLEERAKSFLAMNCSSCHRPAGGASTNLDLRWERNLTQTNAIDLPPMQGDFGLEDARLVAPGHPERSVLLYRAMTAGSGAMPKLAHHDLPPAALSVLWRWIAGMPEVTTDQGQVPTDGETIALAMESAFAFASQTMAAEMQGPLELRSTGTALSDAADAEIANSTGNELATLVEGLMRPWLSPDKRLKTIGNAPDIDRLASMQGDASEGQRWFASSTAGQCQQCHRVNGIGRVAGPDIAAFAKEHSARDLIRHIMDPSLKIDPKWRMTQVLTIDGVSLSGVVVETSEGIELTENNGRRHQIPFDDIELKRVLDQSPMPVGLLASMTEAQVANLIAFLKESSVDDSKAGDLTADVIVQPRG